LESICDKDIADMYQAKLRSIDLGGQKRERISQHAVSKEKDREQVKSYSSSSDSGNEDDKESREPDYGEDEKSNKEREEIQEDQTGEKTTTNKVF
jgi:hypothetical protein